MINCCYSCGSTAELDWSNVTEYSFGSYQTVDIMCTNCYVCLSIEVNADKDTPENIENIAIEAWNKLGGF